MNGKLWKREHCLDTTQKSFSTDVFQRCQQRNNKIMLIVYVYAHWKIYSFNRTLQKKCKNKQRKISPTSCSPNCLFTSLTVSATGCWFSTTSSASSNHVSTFSRLSWYEIKSTDAEELIVLCLLEEVLREAGI